MLGIDVEHDAFDAPVTGTYEEIRDHYLSWLKTLKGRRRAYYRDTRTHLKHMHEVWTAAGFTAVWFLH
jgi:hypothetical protein